MELKKPVESSHAEKKVSELMQITHLYEVEIN
jgi:hypothetical protein